MASYFVQAGTNLYNVSQAGVATQVTLPSDITLYGPSQPLRAAVFGSGANPIVVFVNGGTHDFWVDQTLTARKLQISPPIAAPVLANGVGTGLTGTWKAAATFKVKDSNGATLYETALSPISAGLSITNLTIRCNNIPVSGDGVVNARGLYRTLNGGTTLYPWFDLDDNTTLADDRGGADASLSLLPTTASNYGTPPDLKLVASWNNRLWGVPRLTPDSLRWTEDRNFYAWNATNEIVVPPKNTNSYGITAFIPRRDDLGVCRRKHIHKIVGNSNTSFQRVGISPSIGCVGQESVVVVNNIAYFLSEQGFVEWDDAGVRIISGEQVDSWCRTDTYFNRSVFPQAQGRYNADIDAVEWLLAPAGSTSLTRWVAFNLRTRTWLGPHKTDAFTPTCAATGSALAGVLSDTNLLPLTVFGGSDGYLYKRDPAAINDNTTAVAMSVTLPPLSGNEPDFDKFFDRPTIHTRAEAQGVMTVTPQVGDLNTPADAAMVHDLRQDRETLEIIGVGRYAQLTIAHSSTTERPRIYGLEVPYDYLGRR